MSENLTFVSGECFTHCEIGMEIHRLSAFYNRELPVTVFSTIFLPSVETVKKTLGVNLLPPDVEIDGIKVYSQERNVKVLFAILEGLRSKFNCDITVASSAGHGSGAVLLDILGKRYLIETEFRIEDFQNATKEAVIKRKDEAVKKTVSFIRDFIEDRELPDFVREID